MTGLTDGPPVVSVTEPAAIQPNPFNPQTKIVFDLAQAEPARLEVHDLCGVRVRTLVSGEQTAGRHEVVWDGRADGDGACRGAVRRCRIGVA